MIANRTLVGHKCHNVIVAYSELMKIPLREAFDVFYKSHLYTEIRNGISDMHCRSDGYLAEELFLEVSRKTVEASASCSESTRDNEQDNNQQN